MAARGEKVGQCTEWGKGSGRYSSENEQVTGNTVSGIITELCGDRW